MSYFRHSNFVSDRESYRLAIVVAVAAAFSMGSGAWIRHTNNYRWYVKTLTGRDTTHVLFGTSRQSSVAEQTRMPMPVLSEDSARQSSEDTVYVMDAYLIALKTEDDGDYHLVLRDLDSDLTMRAEIPNSDAEWTLPSSHAVQFRAARASVDAIAGTATSCQR